VKNDMLRLPLNISYTVLLLLTVAYLAISGHASLWKSSLYIGAGVGCFTVLYTITLLVACHRPTHPITSPPSASYPARVCGPLLTIGWALATGFVIAASVKSERIYSENPQWRTWVYAELAAIILTFLSFILVSILQHVQHRRHEILKDQVKVRPRYLGSKTPGC
jgi:hypothetical protein